MSDGKDYPSHILLTISHPAAMFAAKRRLILQSLFYQGLMKFSSKCISCKANTIRLTFTQPMVRMMGYGIIGGDKFGIFTETMRKIRRLLIKIIF